MAGDVILSSYQNLNDLTVPDAGYSELSRYPNQPGLNFQAAEFPYLAGAGQAKMLGNNQAFFFVANPPNNTNPYNMMADTTRLKSLIRNIYDNGTDFTLMIDADVFKNPEQFVTKYQSYRTEPAEETRRALLRKEAELIASFVNTKGIQGLVQEVISEKLGKPKSEVEHETAEFLIKNFKLMGVETPTALKSAVWSVDGPSGKLLAKQTYLDGKANVERPFQLGVEPKLEALKQAGREGATSLLNAVADMQRLTTVNLTLGYQPGLNMGNTGPARG